MSSGERRGGQLRGPSAFTGGMEQGLLAEAGTSTTRFWDEGTPTRPGELPGTAYQCWILYRRGGRGKRAFEEEAGQPPLRQSVIHTGW